MFALCLLSAVSLLAAPMAQDADSGLVVTKTIEEVTVVHKRQPPIVGTENGTQLIYSATFDRLPRILGTADPMRYAQTLAGVQTNNEAASGLHIQGCDDYQTTISLNHIPIYYPSHLLGIFSSFITDHFDRLEINQAGHDGTFSNRLGGSVNMQATRQADSLSLMANVGLVSADATLRTPLGRRRQIDVSGRSSFINLLYGNYLKLDIADLQYGFRDANLDYQVDYSDHDRLTLTGYYSTDRVHMDENFVGGDCRIHWQNALGGAEYRHEGDRWELCTRAYYTWFSNRLDAAGGLFESNPLLIRSDMGTARLLAQAAWQPFRGARLQAGANHALHHAQPAVTEVHTYASRQQRTLAHETELYADLRHHVGERWMYQAGLHFTHFHSDRSRVAVDPRLSVRYKPSYWWACTLSLGRYHQYFHKAGFTNSGLPTDYFFLADGHFEPEESKAVNLKTEYRFMEGKYTLSAEVYFKQLSHVVESTASLLSLLNADYDYRSGVISGKGRNYGLSLSVQKNSGYVQGYLSYTLSRSLRALPDLGESGYVYSSTYERIHDLNLVVNSQLNKHWNVGLVYVLTSGIPYTPARSLYILSRKVIWEQGQFNSARLKPYHRADLSVGYQTVLRRRHHLSFNLSLFNVYCAKNEQFMTYRNTTQPTPVGLIQFCLPSISVTYRY